MKPWLSEQLKHVPSLPGAYVFRDSDGTVLYVGKAKDLRKRVKQYFTGRQPHRTALFVSLIDSVETIIAGSEKEALLLESTLIKRYRPRFNIDLKDDKSYPFFKVTTTEKYPRLEVTRKTVNDGSLYFGPFTDARGARQTAGWLERAFPLRRCRKSEPGGRGRPGRPCIDYQMNRCLGPCSGEVPEEEYGLLVKELVSFLRGGGHRVVRDFRRRMEDASRELRFEEAAYLRDRIRAMETVLEKQDVVGIESDDLDVIGYAADRGIFVLTCLFVRSGMLVGRSDTILDGDPAPSQAVEAFLASHYREGMTAPPKVFIPVGIDFNRAHGELLTEIAGRRVKITSPTRGRGARLLALAMENAVQALGETAGRAKEAESLSEELSKALQLKNPVRRIECVDISHTSGRETRGSTVVWERGKLKKEQYRNYSIRGKNAGDDYRALQEVIKRRFTGTGAQQMPVPDLLLIDGGKGQLSRVREIVRTLGDGAPELASISKAGSTRKKEGPTATDEIYVPERANPLKIPRYSGTLHLLQMMRDEAHRFALSSHQRSRGKDDLLSRLDGIKGVGPVRRKLLLKSFRSLDEIRAAPLEDIASLKGFNRTVARRIKEDLK